MKMKWKQVLSVGVVAIFLASAVLGAGVYIKKEKDNNDNNDNNNDNDGILSEKDINNILDDYGIDKDSNSAKVIIQEISNLTQTYIDDKGVIYADIDKLVSESRVDASKVVEGPLWEEYKKSEKQSYVTYWLDIYASIEHKMVNEKNNSDSDLWTKDFKEWRDILKSNGVPLNAQTFDTLLKWTTIDPKEYPEANEMNGHWRTPELRHTPEGWNREFLEQFDGVCREKYIFNTLFNYETQQETLESNLMKFVNQCPSGIKENLSEQIEQAKQVIEKYNEDVTKIIIDSVTMEQNLAKGANMAQDLSGLTEEQKPSVENSAKICAAADRYYKGTATASDAGTLFKAAWNHEKTEKDLKVTKGLIKSKGPELGK